jgi:hypothetical protein
MERRDFLRGIVAATSVAASTALVKLASAEEVHALAVDDRVKLIPPPANQATLPTTITDILGPVYVRDAHDKFVQIGIITNFEVISPVVELTSWRGDIQIYEPGLRQATASFKGWQ